MIVILESSYRIEASRFELWALRKLLDAATRTDSKLDSDLVDSQWEALAHIHSAIGIALDAAEPRQNDA